MKITLKKFFCIIFTALMLILSIIPAVSVAASKPKASPTPPPVEIPHVLVTPPQEIQNVLDIAYNEWSTLEGKTLPKANKFTKWRTSNPKGFGWCGGFVTWCMMQAEIPMEELENVPAAPVEGIHHVKEASVGKLLRGYMKMGRTTDMPQKGYLLVYGVAKSSNTTVHVGLVWDVEDLGEGKYRLTTIEGNMSNRVKMYVHDYDINAEQTKNLSEIPLEDRTQEENSYFNYRMQDKTWYVTRFLMPYVPGEQQNSEETVQEISFETPNPPENAG